MQDNILSELKRPFHPSAIEWKPQATTKDGAKAMAAAYADVRAYQNRLDEVCGMDWSVTFTPWGDRIVCHLTINGVTRSSTGEGDSQSERSEIAGTAAEAQAFKRAAAMFGLGRYLYNLPQIWVEIDPSTKKFTPAGLAKLEGQVVAHYRRAMQGQAEQQQRPTELAKAEPVAQTGVALETLERLRTELDQLGTELYGGEWAAVAKHNCSRVSNKATDKPGELSDEQLTKLLDGLRRLKAQRTEAKHAEAREQAAGK